MGESRGGVIIAPIVYLVISYFFYYRFVRQNEILRDIEGIEDYESIQKYIEDVKTKFPVLTMVGDVWHYEWRGNKNRRRVRVDDAHAEEHLVYQRC